MAVFTEEELMLAKSVDLCDVAERLGYTVKRIGRWHTLKEMDSVRIYDRRTWFRWSRKDEKGINGGTQIDFLRVFAGLSIREAVAWLLDFIGYSDYKIRVRENLEEGMKFVPYHAVRNDEYDESKKDDKKPFVLPKSAAGFSYILAYLTEERMLDEGLVRLLISKGLIYEEAGYHNVVFKGLDDEGICRFASRRGILDKDKPFKCDVAGSDKHYGFNIKGNNNTIFVFEGAIDLLSFIDMYGPDDSSMVALGMLSDEPLNTILKANPNIRNIGLCLDNDEPGRNATRVMKSKYEMLGYNVKDFPPPEEFKDYNEFLVALKSRIPEKSR